jgi:hypothetical protein
MVLELVRAFESGAGPLRIWRASTPGTTLVTEDGPGIETPLFWPGRSEVVFVRGRSIYAVDYNTGASRKLTDFPDGPRLAGFDITGNILVVNVGNGFVAFERSGDALKPRTDLHFASLSNSLFDLMGLIR